MAELISTNCPACDATFGANNHRAHALPESDNEELQDFWFRAAWIEFTKYQSVKCPECDHLFLEKRLKVFRWFSPKQVVGAILFANGIAISFMLYKMIAMYLDGSLQY